MSGVEAVESARSTGSRVPDPNADRASTRPAARLAPAALLAIAIVLVWAYTHRLGINPLKWEEPRRCLVAMEMLHSGNFLTPRLLGEPYVKKPPLQNWLIALAAGFDPSRVGALAVRSISVIALAGSCTILWLLGTNGLRPARNALPAVIFATTGTVIQHGRAGEIDTLFCFLVLAGVALFEAGRREALPAVQWIMPHVLLAAGVLTKWLAPLFFYPPVAWLSWRDRSRWRPRALIILAGIVLAALLVAAWVVPFTLLNPSSGLEQRFVSEVVTRTAGRSLGALVVHVASYPVLVLSALLPWSFWVLTTPPTRWRALVRKLRPDPWIALSTTIVAWTVLVFWFVPEQKARYLMPAFPFASVLTARLIEEGSSWFVGRRTWLQRAGRHWIFWFAGCAVWIWLALDIGADRLQQKSLAWVPALGGAVVLVAAAAWLCRHRRDLPAAPLLLLGVLYGVVHAGLLEVREAERNAAFPAEASAIASAITDDRAVVVDRRVGLDFCQPLTRRLDHPLARSTRPGVPAWWVTPTQVAPRETEAVPVEPALVAGSLAVYDLPPAEGWSMLSRPLFPPPLEPSVREQREAALAAAVAAREAAPGDVDPIIWHGRRTAYLGRYREAIEIYTAGLAEVGDEPRLLRHRGHRYLTLRELDRAIADLELAARLIEGRPDEVEPDGLPNARGIPTSTLQTNIWYHLGLAHYVRGSFDRAEECFRRCVDLSRNDDMLTAASHWLYSTLRRRGDDTDARTVLDRIHPGMEILENHAYYELLLLYRGERTPDELLAWAEGEGGTAFASAGYGLANWYLVEGRRDVARQVCERIVERGADWPAFGYLAAEADLVRLWDRAL